MTAAGWESPYDDVRAFLVDRLKARETLPGADADALAHLWRTVLLNIHRGGRAKVSALKQGGSPGVSLVPAVRRFANRFSEVTGIAVEEEVGGDLRCVPSSGMVMVGGTGFEPVTLWV